MSELFWMRLHLMGIFVGTTLDLAVSFFAVCRNIKLHVSCIPELCNDNHSKNRCND